MQPGTVCLVLTYLHRFVPRLVVVPKSQSQQMGLTVACSLQPGWPQPSSRKTSYQRAAQLGLPLHEDDKTGGPKRGRLHLGLVVLGPGPRPGPGSRVWDLSV